MNLLVAPKEKEVDVIGGTGVLPPPPPPDLLKYWMPYEYSLGSLSYLPPTMESDKGRLVVGLISPTAPRVVGHSGGRSDRCHAY